MRNLWNIISFLAVVHLFALIMFVGWLWQSQRLDGERLHEARSLFALTVPDAKSAAAKAGAELEALHQNELDVQRHENPPIDSDSQVKFVALIQQQEEQSRRRLQDEKNILLGQLSQNAEQLKRAQQDLDRLHAQWQQDTSGDQKRKNDEQFLQTVKQYEQLPPKQGKRMLVELINQNQIEQAVAYLGAMNARAAGKIIKEFKTDPEIALATQLLEKLRTRGMPTEIPSAGTGDSSSPATGSAAAQNPGHANASSGTTP